MDKTVLTVRAPEVTDSSHIGQALQVVVSPVKLPSRAAIFTFTFEQKLPVVLALSPSQVMAEGGTAVKITFDHLEIRSEDEVLT